MICLDPQYSGLLHSIMHVLQSAETWLDNSLSLEALIAVPAIFVALLVPITFFLMERNDLYGFDKNVILSRIILAKVSIPLTLLVSIVLPLKVSILSVLLTITLLIVIIVVLTRTYKWMTSVELLKYKTTYKQDMRLKFIGSIKDDVEKVDTWNLILNDENLLEKNQRGLVNEFIKAVKSVNDSKYRYSKSNLLALMSRNIRKIDFSDIQSYEDLVVFSIEYFKLVRDARAKNKQSKDGKERIPYPSHYQKELAINLLRIALDKKISDIFDHIFFTAIKKYVAKDTINE